VIGVYQCLEECVFSIVSDEQQSGRLHSGYFKETNHRANSCEGEVECQQANGSFGPD